MIIKFHNDYTVDGITFPRNSEWEYYDKHNELVIDDCLDCSNWETIYRIQTDYGLHQIEGHYVIELDDTSRYNKDYTHEEWNKKITTDSLVEDGDYVRKWKETYNINKPVKDGAEQTDYGREWTKTKKRMDEYISSAASK